MDNNTETKLDLQNTDCTPKNPLSQLMGAWWHRITHSKYSYLFFCFIIPLGIMRLIYMSVGVIPGVDGSVLVLDLNGQYVYFYEALRDFIHGDASLLYSFSRALGGEFLGIFAYYVASPLAWLVALFPKGMMLEALLLIFLLKTGLCGFTFGFYLHKTSRRPNKLSVITVSTMYALCSYAVVQQHNSMWIDALIWLPIITYAIEQLIKKGHYKLFVISLSIMLMSHYYIGYMVCIYVALYFFYYYLAHKGSNEIGETLHFGKSLLRIALFSLLAIGIAAFTVFGAYYSLQFGKNTFSSPDWSFEIRYDLADLIAKMFPGTYDTVRPEGLPIIYCGTLTLLMLPFYFFSKKITLREKIFSLLFLGFFVVSFTLNPLDIAWHGFQVPNWLNYRYSFMFSFFLLTMTYRAMGEIRKQSSKIVFAVGAFLIFMVSILEKFEFKNFKLGESDYYVANKLDTYRTVWLTIVAVIALCAAVYALTRARTVKDVRRHSKILLIVVCVELLLNGVVNITALHFDVTFSSKSSYNGFFDKITPVVSEIQEKDTSFYRMEKTHHRKTNDNMTLGINGLSGSTSTLNKETIKFLNNMGYSSKSHWSKYLGGTPVNDSLLGVKYIVAQKNQPESYSTYNENQAINRLMNDLYPIVTQDPNYVAYQNPYAISIAYEVSENVKNYTYFKTESDGKEKVIVLSPFERLNQTVSAMLGRDVSLFVPVTLNNSTHSNARKTTIAGHTKYAVTTEGTEAYVSMVFSAEQNGHYFFYAPSEYPRETSMFVNGDKFGDFMANESNRIKSIGEYEIGESITVKLVLKGENLYLKDNEAYVYVLDESALKEAFADLASNQYNVEAFTDTSFNGTITTSENSSTIQTTIPYDEGWKVYVDGERVNIYKTFDALIAFDIQDQGTHSLKMVYSPTTIIAGGVISAFSLALFIGIWAVEKHQKKSKTFNDTMKGQ